MDRPLCVVDKALTHHKPKDHLLHIGEDGLLGYDDTFLSRFHQL